MYIAGIAAVTVSFAVTSERSVLSYLSSAAGLTCVIFNAKGNVWGQIFGILFAVLYGVYAYTQKYYGEMLIYFFLMIPIHIFSIISWLKNKFGGNSLEVKVNSLKPAEYILTGAGAAAVTVAFYFLLRYLGTDNLWVSTVSLTASVTAAYLMLRRCKFFSLCFIANDIILVVLWSMKIPQAGLTVLPSVLTFIIFLTYDSYSFYNWFKIQKRQNLNKALPD